MFGFYEFKTYRLHGQERLKQLWAQAEVDRLLPRYSLRRHLALVLRRWAEALEAPALQRAAAA